MSSCVFSAAAATSKRELVIKKGAVHSPEALAVENGDYESLFSVASLNHLVISGFPEVTVFSSKVGQLQHLFQLVLTENALTSLPDEVGSLPKLKFLDVSSNKIAQLPVSLYTLSSLHTLIVKHNCLTDDSFPELPSDNLRDCFPNLHHLDILGNELAHLPDFVYHCLNLQDIIALDNAIVSLEPAIGGLSALKQVDLKRNQLTALPYELSLCSKLKTLDLVNNPISDRRLLKLVTQHGSSKPKAILEYIASHTPKSTLTDTGSRKDKSKRKGGPHSHVAMGMDQEDDTVEFEDVRIVLQVVRPVQHTEILVSPEARRVRPYLVCAIVRNMDLTVGAKFKEFIALQTKLHDGVCKRRRAATIATHDLSKLSLPVSYTCQPAADIQLTPLGTATPLCVKEFIDRLAASKTEKRGGGGKKGGKGSAVKEQDPAATTLSKYLQFVNPSEMVYLCDSAGTVISLPPLTNSENTKIEPTSTDILLEVTSSTSLAICKTIMDTLVCEMCEGGVGMSHNGAMIVEQVRVANQGDKQVLVLYPSRTDLVDCTSIINVVRPD